MRLNLLLFFILLTSIFGCASISRSDKDGASKSSDTISVEQYNEILKENALLKAELEATKTEKNLIHRNDVITEIVELENTPPEVVQPIKTQRVQTVVPVAPKNLSQGTFQKDVEAYRKAIVLRKNGNQGESIKILNSLSRSSFPQIVVRAKHELAFIYEEMNEYDLAVQLYKEVIEKYAFSGLVTNSLAGIVRCYQALGLDSEMEKFQSLKELLES